MQTYLPYPNFTACVASYDIPTLRSVQATVLTLLENLHVTDESEEIDQAHPEILRWLGFEAQLAEFGMILGEENNYKLEESIQRGKYTLKSYLDFIRYHLECATGGEFSMDHPVGWGEIDFHDAEQSALLRLNYPYYVQKFPGVSPLVTPWWVQRIHGRA